nr:GDP-mannose 4,6-dehydratase [Selenomonas artemidis]
MIYVHVVVRRHSTECTEHINLFAELVFKTVAMFSGAAEGGRGQGDCHKTGRLFVDVEPPYFRPAEVEFLWGDSTKSEKALGRKCKGSFPELVRTMVVAHMEVYGNDGQTG